MRFLFSAALMFAAAAAPALCADDLPMEMQHIAIKYSEIAQGIPDMTRTYKKEFWRSGEYGRVQEPVNQKERVNEAMIFLPGNAWDLEQYSKQARHKVLTENKDVHFRVYESASNTSKALSQLKYGYELPYFQQNHAKKVTTIDNAIATDSYSLPVRDKILVLAVDQKTSKPKSLTLTRPADGKQWVIEYLAYETMPFNAALFKAPTDYKITEVTPEQAESEKAEIRAQQEAYHDQRLKEHSKKTSM
jgi:hypothetical protein